MEQYSKLVKQNKSLSSSSQVTMDIHPTAFPAAKRNPAIEKNRQKKTDIEQLKNANLPPLLTRPKRTFGTAKNTNISIVKPPTNTLPVKTVQKPKIPSDKPNTKNRTNIDQKKNHQVSFQQPDKEKAEINGDKDDKEVHTPALLIKTSTSPETPYLTAENCSKCRFSKLETSTYWLNQIRVAESSGKHFVSVAFFRLAFECNAQPFSSLRNELKHYMARHKSVPMDIWNDLNKVYGFSDDQLNFDSLDAVLVEKEDCNKSSIQNLLNSAAETDDESFEYDIVENSAQFLDKERLELVDGSNICVATSDVITEGFLHVNEMNKPLNCPRLNGRSGTSKLKNGVRDQDLSPVQNLNGTSSKSERVTKDASKKG